MCGYFYVGFTDFTLAGITLVDFTNLFSHYDFEQDDSIILSYFKDEWNWSNKLDWPKAIQTKCNH